MTQGLHQYRKEEDETRKVQFKILQQQQMSDDKRQKDAEAFINKLEKEYEQQMRETEEVKERGLENLFRKMREKLLVQWKSKGNLQFEDKIVSSRKHSTGLHHEGHLSESSSFEYSVPENPTDSDYSKGCKSSFQNGIFRQSSPESRNGYQCLNIGKTPSASFKELEKWAESFSLDPATVKVLKEEGFTNLQLLRHLTPDHVTEELQKTKRLSLAQSLALKAAIVKLGDQSSASAVDERSERHGTRRQEHAAPCLPLEMEALALDEEDKTFRFLMVGKTGAGKSTTGNTILGEELLDSDASFGSVTDVCQLKRHQRNGVTIEILDSPGLFDTRKCHEAIAAVVVKSVAGMDPGPHAILYVIKIGRFTEEEEGVYNRLLALFDEGMARYTIIVFTGGDSINPGQTIENILVSAPESMKRVLRACQNRYVVFNNKAPNKQPQIDLLLNKVRALAAKNGGVPYACPKFFHFGEEMEKEIKKRMAKVEEKHLQSKQYVQQLQVKTKQAKDALEREKEEFQRKEEAREQQMKEEEEMRMAQVESLKQQLEQQQMSAEKRRQEAEALLKKLAEEKQQQMREMKEERKREQENIKKKEEEMNKMIEKRMDGERKLREQSARSHEEELRKLKYEILQGKEPSIMEKMAPLMQAFASILQLTLTDFNASDNADDLDDADDSDDSDDSDN